MAITVEGTPNPAAMKFTVGVPVGGPRTITDADTADETFAQILGLDEVKSVFITADFVTVSGTPDIDWEAIVPIVTDVLESSFL